MKKTAEEILDQFPGTSEYPQLLTRHDAEQACELYAEQFKQKRIEISDQEIKMAAEQAFMKRYSGFINEQIDLDTGRRRDIESFKKGAKFVVDSFILPSVPERKELNP